MVAQAQDLFLGLETHVLGEVVVGGDHGAGKHEVLPHQESLLVAGLEKRLGWVHAASPHAKHVHVGFHGVFDQSVPAFT